MLWMSCSKPPHHKLCIEPLTDSTFSAQHTDPSFRRRATRRAKRSERPTPSGSARRAARPRASRWTRSRAPSSWSRRRTPPTPPKWVLSTPTVGAGRGDAVRFPRDRLLFEWFEFSFFSIFILGLFWFFLVFFFGFVFKILRFWFESPPVGQVRVSTWVGYCRANVELSVCVWNSTK